MKNRSSLPAIVIAAVLVGSCSGAGAESNSSTPSVNPQSAAKQSVETGGGGLAYLPLTNLGDSSAADIQLQNDAMDFLIRRCMREKGFDVPPRNITYVAWVDLPFGPRTAADVKPMGPPETEPPMTKEYSLAFGGPDDESKRLSVPGGGSIPKFGCYADAERALWGGDEERVARAQRTAQWMEAQTEADIKRSSDPTYVEALKSWRTCMSEKGFTVELPTVLRQKRDGDPNEPVVRADLACKKSTRFLVTAYQVQAKYEQEALDRRPGLVTEIKDARDAFHARAREVLAGSAS